MTDDTVVVKTEDAPVRKRGRRPSSEQSMEEEEEVLPMVQEVAPVVDPKELLKPILERYRPSIVAPTLMQYVGTSLPKGMWTMTSIDKDTVETAWRAWKGAYGPGDPERFVRTMHEVLGLAMDSTVKNVHMLRLE